MAVTVANVITFVRLLLAVIFFVAIVRGSASVGIIFFMAAWLLDVVDGFAARTLHQETRAGYFFDKVVDRLLLVGGIVVLVSAYQLPPFALLLLLKDALVLPAVVARWRAGTPTIDLGVAGKVLTVLQGAAVLWLFWGLPYPVILTLLVAVLGAYTAFTFVKPTPPATS